MHILNHHVHNINGDKMQIKDIMSRYLVTAETDDNVLYVSNLMKEYDVGFILIMDGQKLYGVVTDRDLVCDLANSTHKIKRYTTTKVITIDEDKSLLEALDMMKTHRIKRLVVTNQNKISGVISLADIYSTDVDSKQLKEALQTIYAINRNNGYYDTDVHDFIL